MSRSSLAVLLLVIALGLWLAWQMGNPPAAPLPAASVPKVVVTPASSPPIPEPAKLQVKLVPPPPAAPASVAVTPQPAPTPQAGPLPATGSARAAATPPGPGDADPEVRAAAAIDVDKVGLMLRDYRTLMGTNPVGTNAEIMKAVMGGNPRQATLGPPEGQHLNANGELIDRWGTPYFFHQLSGTDTQIRSAGPDRKMWTADDVLYP